MVVRDRRAKMRWPDGQMKRGGHCFARTTTPGLSLQSSMALRGPSDPDIPLEAIPPFPGSNPGAPASQCGLCVVVSGCGKTPDIPEYFHHSLVNLLEHRCSPFCNFRFGVPETGSIWDRDRFAEPPIGCRARGWHHWRMLMGPSVLPNVILPVASLLLRHVRRRRTQPCGPPCRTIQV